jgi:propanol-preferring alcohol dehydrogenase
VKAIQLIEIGQPLQMREVPLPAAGEREVLVRVRAAGICRSDVHYRAGTSPAGPLPLTLGHEVAGLVEAAGSQVMGLKPGDRVCLHYLVTCGDCACCGGGSEQFCARGSMLGKHRDGGYAEYVSVPARNCIILPGEIPFEQGAVLMCSSATSLHALNRSGLRPGETVAVFGAGGLGMSAIQLARAFGALEVYAVDINPAKLTLARALGAVAIDAARGDPVAEIWRLTGGRGVDVALELVGLPQTMRQAVQSLAIRGRAVLAGIAGRPFEIDSYRELLGKEATVMGCNDHLRQELPLLIELVRLGRLDLASVVTSILPLDAGAVNRALDALERFGDGVRTVITP